MSFADIIRTVFEFSAIVLLIVGFVYEKRVVAFEQKLARAIRIYFRNRRIRKQRELAKAYKNVQGRAPADIIEEAPVIDFAQAKIRNHHVA